MDKTISHGRKSRCVWAVAALALHASMRHFADVVGLFQLTGDKPRRPRLSNVRFRYYSKRIGAANADRSAIAPGL